MKGRHKKNVGILTLIAMNIAAVVGLSGLPVEAPYGLGAIFYYVLGAVFFFIPVSLVSAELTTGWPEKGGVFRWVGEAFGARWGFLALWMQWIKSAIWFPTILIFAAVAIAFMGPNERWDEALAANKWYVFLIVVGVFWAATFFNFRGSRATNMVTTWGTVFGTLFPALLLIGMSLWYFLTGGPVQLDLQWGDMIPKFEGFGSIVLAASVCLFYAGMEMSSIYVKEVKRPNRDYPLAIFISIFIVVLIFMGGTLAIGAVVPEAKINLVQSLLIGYDDYFHRMGLDLLSPLMALLLAFGVLAQVAAWGMGPSMGLFQVGKAGYLPPVMQITNKKDVQVALLLIQGGIVTLISLVFLIMPTVQTTFQIISQLTVILYLTMYILMFLAAIYLRYKQPDRPRAFRVPGGRYWGMWVVAGMGLLSSLTAYVLNFAPPSQIPVGSPLLYVCILIGGTVLFIAVPLVIYACRKPSWKTEKGRDVLEPFVRDIDREKRE